MGTDWVNLFDVGLAEEVVGLDRPGLARFLAERGPSLAERDASVARARNEEFAEQAARIQQAVENMVGAARPGATRAPGVSEAAAVLVECARGRWSEFAERLSQEEDFESLRAEIAITAGVVSQDLALDYWGCSCEAFRHHDLARNFEAGCSIGYTDGDTALLVPVEVDLIIGSLRSNWSEVTIMDDAGLKRLEAWRDRCAAEGGLRVAYHIDH
jgi:hypothetical protein